MALNLTRDALVAEEAASINDEYDIEVASETPTLRERRIGQLVTEGQKIAKGKDQSRHFEEWCLSSIRVVFAGMLENLALHPNKNGLQQRDIVGTNLSRTEAWQRIYEDYGTRQVVFECKNYDELQPDDYRQVAIYLSGDYGRLAFITSRDDDERPRAGRELDWIRELYHQHKVLAVKLTAGWLIQLLSKLRSPRKHDVVEKRLNHLLDEYSRTYLSLPRTSGSRRKKATANRAKAT
jgi:hypothetical protein